MRLRALLLGLVLTALASADATLLPPSTKRWYDAVQPRESEQRWKRISWLSDLAEGIRQAKAEKRPLIIWSAGDEPLDRC